MKIPTTTCPHVKAHRAKLLGHWQYDVDTWIDPAKTGYEAGPQGDVYWVRPEAVLPNQLVLARLDAPAPAVAIVEFDFDRFMPAATVNAADVEVGDVIYWLCPDDSPGKVTKVTVQDGTTTIAIAFAAIENEFMATLDSEMGVRRVMKAAHA